MLPPSVRPTRLLEQIEETPVLTGNGWLIATGKGMIPLVMIWHENGQQKRQILFLENVLYIPTLASGCNLVSLKRWATEGIKSEITCERMDFWKDGVHLGRASDYGNGWMLDLDEVHNTIHLIALAMCTRDTQTTETWHQRLGHLNKKDIHSEWLGLCCTWQMVHNQTSPLQLPDLHNLLAIQVANT